MREPIDMHAYAPAYPTTRRQDLVETRFGQRVADPYRWLEDDAQADPDVASWISSQNHVTETYLAACRGRAALRARMAALYDYERYGIPKKGGRRYFYTYNSGLQNQSVLFVREGLTGKGRLLLDPATLSADGSCALAQWEPSADGRYLLYAVQQDGSDGRTLRVIDADSGQTLPDRIDRARYSSLTWRQDGKGFFYAGFEAAARAGESPAAMGDHRVWYHALGTAQSADRLVYATPGKLSLRHVPRVTDDGRWLLILSSDGAGDPQDVTILSLTDDDAKPRRLVHGAGQSWRFAGAVGDRLFFRTDAGAPNGRIVTFDAAQPDRPPAELVAQQPRELAGASLVGNRLILAYLGDGRATAELVDLKGRPAGKIAMPGIGTGAGFAGRAGDPETFFRFSDFTTPGGIYRYDTATNSMAPFVAPRLPFDPAAFRDRAGQLPLARRHAGPALSHPAQGCGGVRPARADFALRLWRLRHVGDAQLLAHAPGLGRAGRRAGHCGPSRRRRIWQGLARCRAPRPQAERVRRFHRGGRISQGQGHYRPRPARHRGALEWRPADRRGAQPAADLFAAALPSVGVMDMLRFTQFTAGRYWMDDYGDPDRKADFRNLLAYSPYHNVRAAGPIPRSW